MTCAHVTAGHYLRHRERYVHNSSVIRHQLTEV